MGQSSPQAGRRVSVSGGGTGALWGELPRPHHHHHHPLPGSGASLDRLSRQAEERGEHDPVASPLLHCAGQRRNRSPSLKTGDFSSQRHGPNPAPLRFCWVSPHRARGESRVWDSWIVVPLTNKQTRTTKLLYSTKKHTHPCGKVERAWLAVMERRLCEVSLALLLKGGITLIVL